jgi:hypothetical protein
MHESAKRGGSLRESRGRSAPNLLVLHDGRYAARRVLGSRARTNGLGAQAVQLRGRTETGNGAEG